MIPIQKFGLVWTLFWERFLISFVWMCLVRFPVDDDNMNTRSSVLLSCINNTLKLCMNLFSKCIKCTYMHICICMYLYDGCYILMYMVPSSNICGRISIRKNKLSVLLQPSVFVANTTSGAKYLLGICHNFKYARIDIHMYYAGQLNTNAEKGK